MMLFNCSLQSTRNCRKTELKYLAYYCHRLKYEYFSKLSTELFDSPTAMEEYLSEDEFWLVDAICKNDLETVSKLLHENFRIVEKILANVKDFANIESE